MPSGWPWWLRCPQSLAHRRLRDLPTSELVMDFAVASAGFAALAGMPRRPDDSVLRGALRQAAWRTGRTGVCGLLLTGLTVGAQAVDRRVGARGWISRVPAAVPAGLAVALVRDRIQHVSIGSADDRRGTPPGLRSIGASAGVVALLTGFAAIDHFAAGAAAAGLMRVLPGPGRYGDSPAMRRSSRPGGRASAVWHRAMRRIEAGDDGSTCRCSSRGGAGLGAGDGQRRARQPRLLGGPRAATAAHALASVRPRAPSPNRPAGVPGPVDRDRHGHAGARGRRSRCTSGWTARRRPRARVDLAGRAGRTGALDRSLLDARLPHRHRLRQLRRRRRAAVPDPRRRRHRDAAVLQAARRRCRWAWSAAPASRTGCCGCGSSSGCATVRRPRAPGRAVRREPRARTPARTCSCTGARSASQALGIDRALWIGTPYAQRVDAPGHRRRPPRRRPGPRRRRQRLRPARGRGRGARARPRYVLVSHDNDGVTKFGPDLLATAPAWLGPGRPRGRGGRRRQPARHPAGHALAADHDVLPELVDMKNAQTPGAVPGLGARLPRGPAPLRQRGVRAAGDAGSSSPGSRRRCRLRETVRERLFGSWSISQPTGRSA